MNLATAFEQAARRNPQKTALYWGEREFTYQEFATEIARVAGWLQQQMAVSAGDRVGLWLKNCPEFIPALFGILQAGAVVVPINNFLKPNEVQFILSDAGIATLITDPATQDGLPALQAALPGLRIFSAEQITAAPESLSPNP